MDRMERYWQEILCSDEEKQERLNICFSCDKLNNSGGCTACGCMVEMKVKKRTSSCPLGKWSIIE